MGKYYDIYFTRRDRTKEARPLLSVWGLNPKQARDKANRVILDSGRARPYDLAWTEARA